MEFEIGVAQFEATGNEALTAPLFLEAMRRAGKLATVAAGIESLAPEKPEKPEPEEVKPPEGIDAVIANLEAEVAAEVPGAKDSLARFRRIKRKHFSGVDYSIAANRVKAEEARGIFAPVDDAPAPKADAALLKKHSTLSVDFSACTNADEARQLIADAKAAKKK